MDKLTKRILAATAVGILCGIWNYYNTSLISGVQMPLAMAINMIGSFGIIGFAIGISALKMKWLWHGALIGFIGTLSASLPSIFLSQVNPFLIISLMGIFYGIIIELFTTVIFKLKR